jgi:hypothetical protein
MWLILALVQALVFAPVRETVLMAQVHVLTGPERRRRFNIEQKRPMAVAAFAPGGVVADSARRRRWSVEEKTRIVAESFADGTPSRTELPGPNTYARLRTTSRPLATTVLPARL